MLSFQHCIRYLLLQSKLPQNLAKIKNFYYFTWFLPVRDMGEWLLWVFMVQGMSWGYSRWQELESRLPWSFPVFAGGLSFWLPQQSTQVASVLLHLSLRRGLFTTWWLTSPRVSKEEVLVLFMTTSPNMHTITSALFCSLQGSH